MRLLPLLLLLACAGDDEATPSGEVDTATASLGECDPGGPRVGWLISSFAIAPVEDGVSEGFDLDDGAEGGRAHHHCVAALPVQVHALEVHEAPAHPVDGVLRLEEVAVGGLAKEAVVDAAELPVPEHVGALGPVERPERRGATTRAGCGCGRSSGRSP